MDPAQKKNMDDSGFPEDIRQTTGVICLACAAIRGLKDDCRHMCSGGGTGYARYALAYPAASVNIILYIRIAFVFVKKTLLGMDHATTKGPLEAPHVAHVAKSSHIFLTRKELTFDPFTPRNATQLGVTFP
jgi:hypothetical protein